MDKTSSNNLLTNEILNKQPLISPNSNRSKNLNLQVNIDNMPTTNTHNTRSGQTGQNPQDPDNDERNWPGETNTFISATTDMSHFSQENLARFPKERLILKEKLTCDAQYFSTLLISFIAYLTPILFLLIPIFKGNRSSINGELTTTLNSNLNLNFQTLGCHGPAKTDCHTDILSIVLKLSSLSLASYWLFWQKSRIIYPRTHWPRLISLGMILLTTGIYWLFYAVKILDRANASLESAILFSKNHVDTLLYIHVVAIVVIELRLNSKNSENMYLVEMIRSTDGEQRFYNLSDMTIQEAGFLLLQYYYRDFPLNNPASMLIGTVSAARKKAGTAGMKGLNDSTTVNNTQANILNMSNKNNTNDEFKIYNVDGTTGAADPHHPNNINALEQSKQVLAAAAAKNKKRESSQNANDRYYDQLEWERHCRKRKCRLELAAEGAFDQINRCENYRGRNNHNQGHGHGSKNYSTGQGLGNVMDSQEAATVLFPSLARPLQKYLRTTRQHLHYSLANTTCHLSDSFKHGISHRAFLQRYFSPRPQLSYPTNQSGLNGMACHPDGSSINGNEAVEWNLSSENPLTSNIKEKVFFILGSPDFSLCVTIYRHPRVQLTETFPDSRCKFTLKVNQTSV